MSHFAALAARTEDGWHSTEVELEGLADIDEVAEVMRDASVDDGPVLLFVEEDDEWFAIVRVDGVGEPRTFISDARVVPGSELAAWSTRKNLSRTFSRSPSRRLDDDDDDVELEEEEEEPATRPTPNLAARPTYSPTSGSGRRNCWRCAQKRACCRPT